jgi:hypothetical protein
MREGCRPSSMATLAHQIVVSTAIQFDRELCSWAIETECVWIEGVLAAKFIACKISVPQMSPKNPLRSGSLFAQRSSAVHKELV